jgi:hypothetical protein
MTERGLVSPRRLSPLAPRREWGERPTRTFGALETLAAAAERIAETGDFPTVEAMSPLLAGHRSAGGAGLSFERQTKKTKVRVLADAYDARIFLEGRIPTREGSFHDYFNALVWGTFPRAKVAVNARQYEALSAVFAREGRLPGARTREQDALAMLDEGGLLLATDPSGRDELDDALLGGDEAAVLGLVASRRVRALVFGHALAEHIVSDSTVVRGLPVPVCVPSASFRAPFVVGQGAGDGLIAAVDRAVEELLQGPFARGLEPTGGSAKARGAGAGLLALPIVPALFTPFDAS